MAVADVNVGVDDDVVEDRGDDGLNKVDVGIDSDRGGGGGGWMEKESVVDREWLWTNHHTTPSSCRDTSEEFFLPVDCGIFF